MLLVLVVVGLVVLAKASIATLHSAVELGLDEHYEVTKAILRAYGGQSSLQLWNDQPPLYTVLLGFSFKCFGATIGVARSVAVAFGAMLFFGLWLLVRRRCGTVAAYVAALCLLVAPQVFELSVSVMLEVPAFAVALWALWLVLKWQQIPKWIWLMLSGALLAVALQIKLTAAVAAPALAVEIVLGCQAGTWRSRTRQALRSLLAWGASLVGAWLGLAALLGHVPLEVLWASHFSPQMVARAESLAFSPQLIVAQTETLWAGGAGLLVVAFRRDWGRMALPLVWLLTVTLVHLNHRPWWPYYYLHFAVPLAWISGYAIAELLRTAWKKAGEPAWRARLFGHACLTAASLLLALVAAYGGDRLVSEVERFRGLPRVENSPLVAKMKQYANRTRWVYTQQTIYPFHAGLQVIPELAVLPTKRFWSGQITEEQIVATVKRYRPEQLLLGTELSYPGMEEFMEAGYTLVYEDGNHYLYVAKPLAEH